MNNKVSLSLRKINLSPPLSKQMIKMIFCYIPNTYKDTFNENKYRTESIKSNYFDTKVDWSNSINSGIKELLFIKLPRTKVALILQRRHLMLI